MKNFTIILLSLCWLSLNATSWRVNNNPAIDADFDDINAAIAAASAGDTLYIEGTQYNYGEVTLDKPLVIIGPGYFLLENDSTLANPLMAQVGEFTISQNASGSAVYGLSFYLNLNISASNLVIARNWGTYNSNFKFWLARFNNVTNVVITQNYLRELVCSYSANNIIVSNNYVSNDIEFNDNQSAIVFNNVVGSNITVHNSIVKNNITYQGNNGGIGGTNNVYEYNILNYNPGGNIPPGPGNIIGIDPEDVFVDYDGSLGYSTDGKWQLKEGSIAIGYGENGVDCGMFGGPSPYILSGLPPVPHIYEAIVPVSGSAASGLTVTIKVKSQN